VQSAALRLVVEREREIANFIPQEYWTISAQFLHPEKPPGFIAKLRKIDSDVLQLTNETEASRVVDDMLTATYTVQTIRRSSKTRRPVAPFTTSTLQQDASRAYRFTARKTMMIAQQLYEGIELGSGDSIGLITYMRTDSTQVAKEAQAEARKYVQQNIGPEYLPDKPPVYKTKSKAAQEAHEAVRPTSIFRAPDQIRGALSPDQFKLYNLIWKRFLASQMKAAEYDTLTIQIRGASQNHEYELRVSSSKLRFAGFLRVYEEQKAQRSKRSPENEEDQEQKLPDLETGDPLQLEELFPEQHFTQPPPRYSDATLVKALEELGIGRPSTYAPTVSTLGRRGYTEREKRRLIPTETGMLVNDLVVAHFPDVVDYGFTARMENQLDLIAEGDREWIEVIDEFYGPFSEQIDLAQEQMPELKAEPEYIDRECPESGHQLVIRYGRYGKFIGCSDFPNCRYTEPWLEKIGVQCPKDGGEIVERRTRKGRVFYGCSNYPECDFTSWKKPVNLKCPDCEGQLVENNATSYKCLDCQEEQDKSIFEVQAPDLA
jgi:DNA topoisomerase-1